MSGETLFGEVPRVATLSELRNDGGTDEWLTPRHLTDALGPFDLDPCSPGDRRPWDTAVRHIDAAEDGMRQEWSGRVWLNPPYSDAGRWIRKLADHGDGIALIFAHTETSMWHETVWPRASAILFLRGRLSFCYVSGKPAKANAGAPSALIAYGSACGQTLESCSLPGHLVRGAA